MNSAPPVTKGIWAGERILGAIEGARWIVALQDNWDGEGASGYSLDTWRRAMDFLRRYAARAWTRHAIQIDAPEIGPGPDGSIDLHWNRHRESFVLLINIRSDLDPSGPAGFYGKDNAGTEIKGRFDPDVFNSGLLEWLIR